MAFPEIKFDIRDDRLASCHDELPLWSAPFGRQLLDMVEYKKGITALDIGFGTGFPLLELAMRLGESSTVHGIDPWSAAIKRTKEKASEFGVKNIKIFKGSAEKIPLADGTLDLIVSNNGLNNVPQLPVVVKECSRVAKQGCQFVMTMNLDKTMTEFYDILRQSFVKNSISECIPEIDKHIREKRPKVSDIENLFKMHGFRRKRKVLDTFFYRFADGTALFNHYFIRLGFLGAWKNCIPSKVQDKVFSDVETEINKISKKQNGFVLSVPFAAIEFKKE